MLNGVIANLPNLALALIVMTVSVFIARLARQGVSKVGRERLHAQNAGMAIGRLTQGIVLLLGLLVALSVAMPTFKPSDVIQILGIGSVAIGFAFRDIFQNFLAGILLFITQPFRIGDQIVVSDYEGTVEDIQTRANCRGHSRSCALLPDPAPDAVVVNLAASSVNLRARWWISPSTQKVYLTSRDLTRIKKAFAENGIDLPYPTQQILFHDQTEPVDPDRAQHREGWPAPLK